MAKGVYELLWIKGLLIEIGYSPNSAMNMFCDNKYVMGIAQNPIQHVQTKHVEVDQHFIKEKLEVGLICFFRKIISTFSRYSHKAVPNNCFHSSLGKLGI